jgi:beta-glucosidase
VIDDKVRRILRLAQRFGWLDGKPVKDESLPLDNPQSFAVALEVAREACVLLKNEDKFLPLSTTRVKKLAVIGWHADPGVIGGGGCSSFPCNHRVSMLDGLRELLGDEVEIVHEAGPPPSRHPVFERALYRAPDGGVGLKAEFYDNPRFAGPPARVRTDRGVDHVFHSWPPVPEVKSEHYSVRWTGFIDVEADGEHLFHYRSTCSETQVWIDGEPLLNLKDYDCKNVTTVSRHLTKGAHALRMEWVKHVSWADVFFGWEPASVPEAELEAAINAARGADAALVFTGFDLHTERESADRSYDLPPVLERLITGVAEANANTAVVLHAGGGAGMASWVGKVKALLHVWYPGQEGGRAVAEILFGHVSPSGKLPVSIEQRWEDNSAFGCYHDADGDKRVRLSDGVFSGYRHLDAKGIAPLFPFGHGLGYTTFNYSDLSLSQSTLRAGEALIASVNVTNIGERAGAEVVQLYVSPQGAPLPRPPQELKGFSKVFLAPGETRKVSLTLGEEALRHYDVGRSDWWAAPGMFKVRVGSSSRDIRLEREVEFIGI